MSSSRERKRRRTDDSFQKNFRELRDRGAPDTGPKRPKGRRTVALTPAVATPTSAKKQQSRGKKGGAKREQSEGDQRRGRRTPRTRLKEDIKDLIEGAVRLGDITPAKPRTTLTPYVTPETLPPQPATEGAPSTEPGHPSQSASSVAVTPAPTDTDTQKGRRKRRSNEVSLTEQHQTTDLQTIVEETPGDTRVLRSALKGIHSMSSLHKRAPPPSAHQVSFGEFVQVTEYSPEKSRDSTGGSTSDSSFSSSPSTAKVAGQSSAAHHSSLRTDLEPLEGEEEEEGDMEEDEEGGGEVEEREDVEEEEGKGEEQLEEEDEGSDSEKVRMKTPRVMPRAHKVSPKETTPRSKDMRKSQKVVTRKGRKQTQQQTKQPSKPPKTLSRTLIKNLFMLSSKRRLTTEAADLVVKFSELYLKQCSEDLVTYSSHAGRKTVEIEDVILLLKRQRFINDTETFEYLVNTHLPLEYVEELLPCAVAGKKIIPSRLK